MAFVDCYTGLLSLAVAGSFWCPLGLGGVAGRVLGRKLDVLVGALFRLVGMVPPTGRWFSGNCQPLSSYDPVA